MFENLGKIDTKIGLKIGAKIFSAFNLGTKKFSGGKNLSRGKKYLLAEKIID